MPEDNKKNNDQPKLPAISAGKRKMLQAWFASASQSSSKGEYDYANEWFKKCVTDDPANRMYVSSYLGNLRKKYNNDKKGSRLAGVRGAGAKTSLKKAVLQKKWMDVIGAAVNFLELNPWDVSTLTEIANACEHLDCRESQIEYLKGALEGDLNHAEVNRLLGRALDAHGEFDNAVICFQRVLKALPSDDEARRAVADLAVKKTIRSGGYEDAETSTEVMANQEAKAERMGLGGPKHTPEQQLEKQIAKTPADIGKYVELADLHIRNERYEDAEKVLTRAFEASGGELGIRERLEDIQVRRQRQALELAQKRLQSEPSPEREQQVAQLKVELLNKEVEILRVRCDRYPTQLVYKYELGMRLKALDRHKEAIQLLQEARQDPRRKGAVLLAIGECFQKIDQFKLAMSSYESAVQEIGDRDPDLKKTALYRAGRLEMFLAQKNQGGELDKAEKFLSDLAGLDFGYKDVSALLDKIRRIRNKG